MSAISTPTRPLPCPRSQECPGPVQLVEVRYIGNRQVFEKASCRSCSAETLPQPRARRQSRRRVREVEAAAARAAARRDPFPDGPAPWAK